VKFRNRYEPNPRPAGLDCSGFPSMTRQEFKAECDINTIMSKHRLTGDLPGPWSNAPVGSYEDLASAPDFMEAQNILLEARQAFDALPSRVRTRFGNDPAQFLAFVHDPGNIEEGRTLGIYFPAPLPVTAPTT